MREYIKGFFTKQKRGRSVKVAAPAVRSDEIYSERHDMAYEADRIIRESIMQSITKGIPERSKKDFLRPFLFGSLFTLILALAVYFIFLFPYPSI